MKLTPYKEFRDNKAAKPMLEMPPQAAVPSRKVWDVGTMIPADVEEFVQALHKQFGLDYLKELVLVLFIPIVHNQHADATRQLLQQLYNLHYTPSFTERRHGTPQF